MNLLAIAMGLEPQGQVQQIASTFGVDWPHLVAQIVSFGIVCLLLHRYAYRPVLRMLEERRQQIAQGVADRQQIKAELANAEAERHRMMLEADVKARQVVEEAHTAAARLQEREMQKAISVAEQVILKAREAAAQERERMLAELKRDIGLLVVQAAATVSRKVLTPEDQQRMAEDTLVQFSRAA